MISLQLTERTWAHRVPAGAKLLFLCTVSIAVLPLDDMAVMTGILSCVLVLYGTLGREALQQIRLVKPLMPILVAIFALHLWVHDWQVGATSVARLLAMVLLANAVTMTTTMTEMMDAVQPVFWPLKVIGFRPEKLALAVAHVIRFIPVLFAEYQAREAAWRARQGGRQKWRLLPNFFLSIFDLTTQVANALDARGFGRTAQRTKQ